MEKLTEREVVVLKLILDEGYDSGEIAEVIFRSRRTVHDIRYSIRDKLELKTYKRSEFFNKGRKYLNTLKK